MESIKHICFGYCKIIIKSSFKERFLNLCMRQKILLWNVIEEEGVCSSFISRRDVKRLAPVLEKTNTTIEITGRYGLPFFLCTYRKRKLLVLGIVLGILSLLILSQFIWEIRISGNTVYTKEDMMQFVCREYVPLGTLRYQIDCESLEESLRQQYENLGWVSCSLQGCRLSIEVKESLEDKREQYRKKPCDLIALKDGVITSIVTINGTPLYQKGDKVKKGDTLISGNVYIYSDNHEVLETHQIAALGEVRARTKVPYRAVYSRTYYRKQYKKKTSYIYALYLCGRRIPLMPGIKQDKNVDEIVENRYISLGNTYYLPVWLEQKKYRRYVPEKVKRTERASKAYAKNRIKNQTAKWEKMGIRILRTNIQIEVNAETCVADGYFILEESIAKIRGIRKLTKEQEEKIRPTEEVLW